jgi:hypothetical protein
MLAEEIFFGLWSKPNFREKTTNEEIKEWPVYGWNYDVLIGGLYPDQKAEWEYGLAGYTLELAFPVTLANKMLKRVRQLFDDELKRGIVMTSTYRSGINIKCKEILSVKCMMVLMAQQLARLILTSSARSQLTRKMAQTGTRVPSCLTSRHTGPPSGTTNGLMSSSVSGYDGNPRRSTKLTRPQRPQGRQHTDRRVPVPPTLDEEYSRGVYQIG